MEWREVMKTTGKFKHRRILEDRVIFLKRKATCSSNIADHCGISVATVNSILKDYRNGQTITQKLERNDYDINEMARKEKSILIAVDEFAESRRDSGYINLPVSLRTNNNTFNWIY